MLDYVQADDGVEFLRGGIGIMLLAVGISHTQVRMVWKKVLQIREVLRIDIAGVVQLTRNQLHRQIPRPSSNFQNALANVRPDDVGHPLRKAWSAV